MHHLTRSAMALVVAALGFAPAAVAQDTLFDLAAETSITGQVYSASPGGLAEIFLIDASEILLAPGSSVRIDRYSYDPTTGQGVLELTVLSGTVRVAGGLLNDQTKILIKASGADIRLDQGAAVIAVTPGGMRTYLSYGRGLRITSAGVTRDIMRPEFQVAVVPGAAPSGPERMGGDQLAADFDALSAKQAGSQPFGAGAGTQVALLGDGDDFGAAQGNEDGRANQTVEVRDPVPSLPGGGASGASTAIGGVETIVLNAPAIGAERLPSAPPDPAPAVPGGGFAGTSSIQNELDGTVSSSWIQRRQDQDFDDRSEAFQPVSPTYGSFEDEEDLFLLEANRRTRDAGPTANKLFATPGFTYGASEAEFALPISEAAETGGLTYFWGKDSLVSNEDFLFGFNGSVVLNFVLDIPIPLNPFEFLPSDPTREVEAPFLLLADSDPASPVITSAGFYVAAFTTFEIIDGVPTPVTSPASVNALASARGLNFGAIFNDARTLDNFFYLELVENGSPDRLLFAAGDIDRAGSPTNFTPLTVDRFFLSAGLTDAQEAVARGGPIPESGSDLAAGQRAFLRAESWTALGEDASLTELTDSGFYVINPASRSAVPTDFPSTVWTSQAIHVDFGLAGDTNSRRSTISATIGTVDYRDANIMGEVDALTSAFTIGSSRSGDLASTTFYGPIRSTAAGGGNPRLDVDNDGLADEGRMGFVVLENAGFVFDDVVDGEGNAPSRTLPGGVERAVGSTETQNFALVRLGQGVSSQSIADRGLPGARQGYAAAFIEDVGENGVSTKLFNSELQSEPNLALTAPDPQSNTFSATLSRSGDVDAASFELGGATASAYANNHLFGAISADLDANRLALVSGDMVVTPGASPGSFTLGDLEISFADTSATTPGYSHLEWGFFFGDIAAVAESGHVHMGTFAAGEPVNISDLNGSQGEAVYRGHAIGEVFDNGARYLATGTYSETFVFNGGSGSGQTVLDFDRTVYTGNSIVAGGDYLSAVANQDQQRAGSLVGRFVGPLGGPGATPMGIVGRFNISDTDNNEDTTYIATGTFGGEQN